MFRATDTFCYQLQLRDMRPLQQFLLTFLTLGHHGQGNLQRKYGGLAQYLNRNVGILYYPLDYSQLKNNNLVESTLSI